MGGVGANASATGIYLDVDTTTGKFSVPPAYVTSIGGTSHHWNTTGATSVYPVPGDVLPTATRFRVYVRWSSGSQLDTTVAALDRWHINWIGMEL